MTLVPFDDRDGWVWIDGSLVPWRDARLHVLSHGLHYASAVFEGERAYAGNIFRLRDHTNRLHASAGILGFEIPWTAEQIDDACLAVLEANGLTDGYIRPIAWRGSEVLGVSARGTSTHLAIAAWAWPAYFGGPRMEGIRLAIADWKRPSPDTAPTAAKATGLYMVGTMAKMKAEAEGYSDALMMDWRGRVAETTGTNVFFVMDGDLHTPDPDCFLDGLTRRTVVRLAQKHQMNVITRPIEAAEISRATEVFLAGTAAEVTAVREIGPHRYTPGPITETLMKAYDSLVRQSPATVAQSLA
ncbi:MAG: branched-chain amino acid aminotransferase [Nevskia sp.]|nr:branched-chain amino acid aminotransferase [Nevskia sp.]